MTATRDRRAALAAQTALNGVDFVEVANAAETLLRVHFLVPQTGAALATFRAGILAATITGGETVPTVAVAAISAASWSADAAGRPVLALSVAAPGDFSTYTLGFLTSAPVLDRYFATAPFSFKATCPSTLDCAPLVPPPGAPPPGPPIDYLAKDFDSFRRALLDFSALRYPEWQERSEADFGVMFAEALASVADDLSYQQDRVAAEAWLETATERRSLVRLARLVDYEPRVPTAARTTLRFEMLAGATGPIPAGLVVSALAPEGAPVDFETGTGLLDASVTAVDAAWNAMPAYWFDDETRVVAVGARTLWVEQPAVALPFDAAHPLALLVEVAQESSADAPLRAIVHLAAAPTAATDPLFGAAIARLDFAEPLPFALDLARTTVGGNLVPATHGRRATERFLATAAAPPAVPNPFAPPRAVVRTGANGTVQFLHPLAQAPLAWLAADGAQPLPELDVQETATGAWAFQRKLLDAKPFAQVVTVDPMRYRLIDATLGAYEYDGSAGDTLRFGDGSLGAAPPDDALFTVTYRVGGGARGNVAADALTRIAAADRTALGIAGVSNPLAAVGGADEESADQVRALAPYAFRATQYRAVRPSDYEAAARTLPWVQRAGTRYRWTGSWLTVFTAADPLGAESLTDDQLLGLTALLERYKLAGYEQYVLPPRYASLDLDVTVCARPDAFRGDVKRGALTALGAFFAPDHFTFGVPLERSALEAALQEVPGVDGVVEVRYRRRGYTPGYIDMLDTVDVAGDEIVRVDNDPSRPDAGSLRIDVRGGK